MKVRINRVRRILRLCLRRDNGTSALEFAIIAPLVFIILLGTLELGLDMIVDASVQLAAQAASRAGLTTTAPASGTRADQANAIVMSYLGGWTNIGATVNITELNYGTYVNVNTANSSPGLGGLGDVVSYNISVTMKGFSGIPQLLGIDQLTFQRNYLVQNEK